ncbi:MAG: rRNA maturation RNase YbeY [Bacteroidales bacterium]|nr:rRNA maturation RNase YbeY [Bacteroidales bacterium]
MISFFKENTAFDIKSKNKIKKWLKSVAEGHGYTVGDLNYIFCDDEYLLQMNRQYLGHDYYTDIITFDSREDVSSKKIDGDIFISVDTVRANGAEYGEGFDREMMRVIAHGLLHLSGFDDTTEKLQKQMRAAENDALKLWDTITMS